MLDVVPLVVTLPDPARRAATTHQHGPGNGGGTSSRRLIPLRETLLAPDAEPAVGTDCYQLIGQELDDKSGVSGTALKLAYQTVNAFMPGHIEFMVRDLLPDMVDQLDPFWAGFRTSGGAEFGDYLTKRGDEVAEARLTVTDARCAASGRPTVIKAYKSVRGNAGKHITAALPRVGALVQTYAG